MLRLPHCLLLLRVTFLFITAVGLSVAAYSALRRLTRSRYPSVRTLLRKQQRAHPSASCQSQCPLVFTQGSVRKMHGVGGAK